MRGQLNIRWLKLVSSLFFVGALILQTACSQVVSNSSAPQLDSDSNFGIVAGASVSQFDSIAASTVQLYALQGGHVVGLCTGTLISNHLVLTAAHCVLDNSDKPVDSVVVHFSTKMVTDQQQLMSANSRLSARIISHELYNQQLKPEMGTYDIALIKLRQAAPAHAKPISINGNSEALADGSAVVVAGFGQTNGVTKTQATGLNKLTTKIVGLASQTQYATAQPDGGVCHGDSGGPMYAELSGKMMLVAVTNAFAQPKKEGQEMKDDCTGFGVFTSTAALAPWISEKAKLLIQP